MKHLVWIAGLLLGLALYSPASKAGTIYFLDNRPELHGKLTLNASSIHVEGGNPPDVNLADILEADFSENDFHLDYFSSDESPDQLPGDWQGHDIGSVPKPGSYAYAKGALTLTSSGPDVFAPADKCYFLARPWNMDEGQWTIRIKERADTVPTSGIMLRTGLEQGANMFTYGLTHDNGFESGRRVVDTEPGRDTRFQAPAIPGWIRLSRYQNYLMVMETSDDGKSWEMSAENGDMRQPGGDIFSSTTLAGLFVTGISGQEPGTVVLDHITFAPSPAEPETLRPGVLLRSGSFLAGWFNQLDPKGGSFNRNSRNLSINADQVSAVMWQPTTLHQIADVAQQSGVIMKNGDFMASDLQNLSSAGAQMTSVVLGPMDFIYTNAMRACVLHPFQDRPSEYEIRLKDGSDIRATSLEMVDNQLTIHEVSGPLVTIAPDEIAQFRAGTSHVESLIRLPWKASSATIPEATAAAATNAAVIPQVPPITPTGGSKADDFASVQCWQGPGQEEIMAVTPGTAVAFPLVGSFHAVALRVALLSDTPQAQALIRVMENGREIGRVGPLSAGEQPRLMQADLQDSKDITLVADSAVGNAKVLLLDPVAIRK